MGMMQENKTNVTGACCHHVFFFVLELSKSPNFAAWTPTKESDKHP